MDKWLQNFAYRTGISWDVFAVALISSLLIAVATIISQAYRAANSNPAEILRDE
jgi:putative ABC transport system permease protein